MMKRWLRVTVLSLGMLAMGISMPVGVAAEAASQPEGAVNLKTDDGVQLFGVYSPGRKGGPGVVLLHQLGRSHEEWAFLTESLGRAGYHVLAIDLRGHGKSLIQGESTLSLQDLQAADYLAMTHDVAAAVTWLRSQPEVNADRVAVIGASLGANLALKYAAGDPRIAQVALLSPGLDYKGVSTEDSIAAYGSRPLFMAVSREDNYAAKSVLVLDASSPNADKEMKIFTGAGHGTRMLTREPALETALITWLNEPTAPQGSVGSPPSVPTREGGAGVGSTSLTPQ